MSGWRAIETAPKDERLILYVPPGEREANWRTKEMVSYPFRVGEGLWLDDAWHWANDSCECCYGPISSGSPTHWMPLPEAPK